MSCWMLLGLRHCEVLAAAVERSAKSNLLVGRNGCRDGQQGHDNTEFSLTLIRIWQTRDDGSGSSASRQDRLEYHICSFGSIVIQSLSLDKCYGCRNNDCTCWSSRIRQYCVYDSRASISSSIIGNLRQSAVSMEVGAVASGLDGINS
jgi:hypothetical protein